MRERVTNILMWLGAIALFLAFMPYFRYSAGVSANKQVADYILSHPGSIPYQEEYRFGWTDSPLVYYQSEQRLDPAPDGGLMVNKSSQLKIGWLSRSSFALALAIVLFCALRVFRSVRPPEKSQSAC